MTMKNQFKPYLQEAIQDLEFKAFTSVQTEVFSEALKKRNLLAQSMTGTGKTHAFLLPLFQHLNEEEKHVQALICAPTQDLARQIYKMATHLAKHAPTRIDIRLYVGGEDRLKEIERLRKTQPQIVIGTPGKIKDLAIDENKLLIHTAETFVVDEVDMTFEAGFLDEIGFIVGKLKNPHIMLFSATMNEEMIKKINPFLGHYKRIELKDDNKLIKHVLLSTRGDDKLVVLQKLLPALNPYLALVFANTKERVDAVAEALSSINLKVAVLHGDVPIRQRKRIINDIHALRYDVVVASDMAARGIDIIGISHVIQTEWPKDLAFYVHRAGRTGRVDLEGICISLVDEHDEHRIATLKKRGIAFKSSTLKSGVFSLVEPKEKAIFEVERPLIKTKKKTTQVKPGYKKKHAKQKRK